VCGCKAPAATADGDLSFGVASARANDRRAAALQLLLLGWGGEGASPHQITRPLRKRTRPAHVPTRMHKGHMHIATIVRLMFYCQHSKPGKGKWSSRKVHSRFLKKKKKINEKKLRAHTHTQVQEREKSDGDNWYLSLCDLPLAQRTAEPKKSHKKSKQGSISFFSAAQTRFPLVAADSTAQVRLCSHPHKLLSGRARGPGGCSWDADEHPQARGKRVFRVNPSTDGKAIRPITHRILFRVEDTPFSRAGSRALFFHHGRGEEAKIEAKHREQKVNRTLFCAV
jgi:hypothetical protein